MKNFIPKLSVDSIYDIDLTALKERGIKGIITDLDNTLVGAKDPHANPKLKEWFTKVQKMGFQVVIVSNNDQLRVSTFANPLQIPFIFSARKPMNGAFRRALELMKLEPKQAVVIGDQLVTDVLGGNRMGLQTILVIPISLKDEGFFTKINRRIEKMVMASLRRRGHVRWED